MKQPRAATAADLSKLLKQGRSKYRAKRVQCEGIWFDSLIERTRYLELRLLEKVGEIRELIVHPKYDLGAGISYTADFEYMRYAGVFANDRGHGEKTFLLIVEDVKSKATRKTRDYRLKRKLFKERYGFEITEVVR